MKLQRNILCVILFVGMFFVGGCLLFEGGVQSDPQGLTASVAAVGHWRADVPLDQWEKLPSRSFSNGIGVVTDTELMIRVWEMFSHYRPSPMPKIDFSEYIVVVVYNVDYYNMISRVMGVDVQQGIATPVVIGTRTTLKIQDKLYCAMMAVPRKGILGVMAGDRYLKVPAL